MEIKPERHYEKKFGKVLRKVFFRSFLLQALWNFKGMQNAGFLYTIKPVLDLLYENKEEKKAAYLRHLDFFNTHPYCASFIFGVVAREEKLFAESGDRRHIERAVNTKKILGGPIAAFGDSMIWGIARPFTALIGATLILLFSKNVNLMWLGPAAAFVIFNIFHLIIRYRGIFIGFEDGEKIFDKILAGYIHKWAGYLRTTAIVLISLLLVRGFMSETGTMALKMAYPVSFVLLVLFLNRISATLLFYIVVITGGIFAGCCH
ncbi:MAG: PTS system mannose/fructose/sorbose family transporter subunit IID [bacterium]